MILNFILSALGYSDECLIREVEQGPEGALFVREDGDGGRLLKLTPGR